jgi:hypothetical protein
MTDDETRRGRGLDDDGATFDSEKRQNLLYMIRVFQDDYKKQVLESEFRENQVWRSKHTRPL